MKYAWIQEHQDSYPVQTMCCLLGVSRSGFYKWLDAAPSPRAIRSETIKATVRRVFEASRGIYGSKKIAHELQKSTAVEKACRNTVAKAMKEMGLKSRIYRRFRPTTTVADPSRQPAANLLNQEFHAARPNQKWVADITYLPTSSGWVYLAVVLDLFSRKVVGCSMSKSQAKELITAAIRKAIQTRKPSAGTLLHHSDRGCRYTSESYRCSSTSKPFTIQCVSVRRSNTICPINLSENKRCREFRNHISPESARPGLWQNHGQTEGGQGGNARG